jgi:hypothetical protein
MDSSLCVDGVYRFGAGLEYEIRVARDIRDRKRAWRFVRQAYARKGYASDNTSDLWYGIHDALPSTTTFLLEKLGVVVGTITVVFDSAIGLPADELYSEELGELRSKNRRLSEIISLVSAEPPRPSNFRVIRHLFRVAFIMAYIPERYTDFVITVNPRHAAFYCKIMQFQTTGPERVYKKVSGATAVLLRLNFDTTSDAYYKRFGHLPGDLNLHQFFFGPQTEEIVRWLERERRPLDESSINDCFLNNPHIVSQASLQQLAYIRAAARGELKLKPPVPTRGTRNANKRSVAGEQITLHEKSSVEPKSVKLGKDVEKS